MGKPAIAGEKSMSEEMVHKHYTLPEAKHCLAGVDGKM